MTRSLDALSEMEAAFLQALLNGEKGGAKEVAATYNYTGSTANQTLSRLRERYGAQSTPALFIELRARGFISEDLVVRTTPS